MDIDIKIALLNALELDGEVIGGVLFIQPNQHDSRVLRIELASTVRSQEYYGLRVQVVHRDNSLIDVTVITFAETGAFPDRRDGRITSYTPSTLTGFVPDGMREALARYAGVWFDNPQLFH